MHWFRKAILALSLLVASFMLLLARGEFRTRYIIGTSGPGGEWGKEPLVGFGCMDVRPVVVIWCWTETSLPASTPGTDMEKHGFAYHTHIISWRTSTGKIPVRLRQLEVPRWVVGMSSLLFLIYPITAFICGPYRRYRRRKKGLCLICGYNLTGNMSGVCPECGEKIGPDTFIAPACDD